MRKSLSFILAFALIVPSAFCATNLLRLQRAESPMGPWQEVPADTVPVTAAGEFQDTFESPTGYYRMQIEPGGEWGIPLQLFLVDVPPLAVEIAQSFLKEAQGIAGDNAWEDAMLGSIVFPLYTGDPGEGPAFMEFKVVPKPAEFQPGGPEPLPEYLVPPRACDQDRGFILVSLTEELSPVVDFATEGLTRTECLRKQANSSAVKIVRYDDSFMVAENEKGEMLGRTGPMPVYYPPECMEYCDKVFEGLADETGEQAPDPPGFEPKQYESYEAFKKDYLESEFYKEARRRKAEEAASEWDVYLGRFPLAINVLVDQPTLVLQGAKIEAFSLEDPRLAKIEIQREGLLVTGIQVGSSLLHVVFADGSEADYILVVDLRGALSPEQPTGWSSWTYYYAGNWGDQRRYTQEWGGSCWSGCGATAWAMDYGWFDHKGYCNAIDGVAPLYNNGAVRDCIWYIVPRIGTWCSGSSGATNPWDMYKGYKWAQSRGHGYSVSWAWTLPCLSWSTCREKARDSIRDLGRPAIIGIGCTGAHYPLAYGYAWQKYTWLGITWSYNRWFKCNMGWGGSSPQWKKASVWYGQRNNFW
jgi:hypothetical protein